MHFLIRHLIFIVVTVLLFIEPTDALCQKKTSVKKQQTTQTKKTLSRAEYEKQQKDLQTKIKATEKMISDNDKSVNAQRQDMKLREQEIGQRRALLVAMHKEIEAIAQEEDSLKNLIADLQKNYDAKKKKYGQAMRHMYRTRSGYEELTFVLSSKSMAESLRRMRYLRQYSDWRKKEALALEQQRIATENAKTQLAATREERQVVFVNIENERAALTLKQQQQEAAVSDLRKRGKELQAELVKDQRQQAEIQRKIQQMIDEERRKAAAVAKASNNKKGSSSDNKTQKKNTPTEVSALTGNFRQNKGKMPYPVDSNYAFLQHYREKKDGNLSIRLSTTTGANACAVFEGTVINCSRSSDDYTVIVSHGDYMSVYSNLSSVNVKVGQKVQMRQVIGKIKLDVNGRRGELMFWIYSNSDAENPEVWLKR